MNVIARFEPISADINPHISVPTIAPIEFIAPASSQRREKKIE